MSSGVGPGRHRLWRWLGKAVTAAFFGLVAYLLISQARTIEWPRVFEALKAVPATTLGLAALLAGASYAVYSSYDLLSRRYAGHRLSTPQVLATTFVSYAFNLNLGALVGGLGFRHRLYSRLGLDNGVITRVIAFSMATNWLGYLILAGLAFLLFPPALPERWSAHGSILGWIGALMLSAGAGYLLLAALAGGRHRTVRGHRIELPSARLAMAQLGISGLNWLLIATIVWVLLSQRIGYPTVLAVLLIAAVAGVITHVPAGLGVLEAVFVTLLADAIPTHELLGALLAYRALYYLLPLLAATLLYFGLEARIGRGATTRGDGVRLAA